MSTIDDFKIKTLKHSAMALKAQVKALEELVPEVRKLYPLSEENITTLSFVQKSIIDSFLFRTCMLQDISGASTFRLIADRYPKAIGRVSSAIDILNFLEKDGLIQSADFWKQFREIRNAISHEYPLYAQNQIIAINEAIEFIDQALVDVKNILQWVDKNY